jgi:EAL domain-containing protein (putative c-di-GMP-specific phosphodiesterase class I)
VRWQHPQRGLVPPAAFIPFAEETGLIVQLGELVLRRACRDLAGWRRRHPAARGLRVGVNVAALQLERGGFLATVDSALAEAGLDADALTIEVTETTLLRPTAAVLAELSALRERGLLVAIDDFGGGSSPLAYLRSLPVDVLKIDRSFVAECDGDARDAALVRGVVRLAHELGLRTVGEGVERPAQAALLHDAGCDLSQGYLTGRPVPADAVEELLAATHVLGAAA